VASHTDSQIAVLVRAGVKAMPPHDIDDPEMKDLLAYAHTLQPIRGARTARRITVKLQNRQTLEGQVLNQTNFDLQLRAADGIVHLLSASAGGVYRESPVSRKMDWPRYDGSLTGNRNSGLDQINASNVQRLTMKWMF